MFGKIKQFFGIEGVKMQVIIPEEISKSAALIEGEIEFSTMNTQRISTITVKLVERYTQGRRKEKRTQEFLLGEIIIYDAFMIYPEEDVIVEFELPYKKVQSNIDAMADRGGIRGSLAKIAKTARGAKSEYRIEAEAKVAGTALSPFAKTTVKFI